MTMTNPQIDWQVTGVFDPDTGLGFAYTVGLVEHGLPELHVWNQPTDGDDPGAGWRLSGRDMQSTLNRVASELVACRRAVGDRWSTTVDNGLTTIRWHLAEPVERDEVKAYGVAEGALVAPLRWELERTTVTPPPVGVQRQVFAEVVVRLVHLPGSGRVAPDHATFGPAAAAIAHARRVALGMDPMSVVRCTVGSGGEELWFGGALGALLEAGGRGDWVESVRRAAHDDAAVLASATGDPSPDFVRRLASMFEGVLGACYLAVAASDLLPHLQPANGVSWTELAGNILGALADPSQAEAALGPRAVEAYRLVGQAEALAGIGDDARDAAWLLAWWAVSRHGARLDENRWMDLAEVAGCSGDDTLADAVAMVGAWAVAGLAGAPAGLTDAVVPFVEALR